jgi:hypothetical protein
MSKEILKKKIKVLWAQIPLTTKGWFRDITYEKTH